MPLKLMDASKIISLGWKYSSELEEGVKSEYQVECTECCNAKKRFTFIKLAI